jgi:hypothetical protein
MAFEVHLFQSLGGVSLGTDTAIAKHLMTRKTLPACHLEEMLSRASVTGRAWPMSGDPKPCRVYAPRVAARSARPRKAACPSKIQSVQ